MYLKRSRLNFSGRRTSWVLILQRKNEIIFNLRLFWWKAYMVMSENILIFVIWFKDFYFISYMKRTLCDSICISSLLDKSTKYVHELFKKNNVHVLTTPQLTIDEVVQLQICVNSSGNHLETTAKFHSIMDIFQRFSKNFQRTFSVETPRGVTSKATKYCSFRLSTLQIHSFKPVRPIVVNRFSGNPSPSYETP